MTFISYAQNFEDVLLWRALQNVPGGTYIDVGASHPDIDSVTRAFYERGWRGINVEPVAEDARRLRLARPRDVNLEVALGAAAGTARFFVVEGTGLSTLHAQAASEMAASGHAVRQTEVRIATLAGICADHISGEIHFLKIDVEGAEPLVLAGADFARFRPWIVLIEATAPMSTTPTHGAWEHLLIGADYRFVWFDGLNRFYVAAEHADALAGCFLAPPNVFDNFLRAADSEWARRIARAEAMAAGETARAAAATVRAEHLARALSDEQIARMRLQLTAELKMSDHDALVERARAMQQRALEAEDWLRAMRTSTSWKLTAPLRRTLGVVARVRGAVPSAPAVCVAEAPVRPPAASAMAARAPMREVHQFHSGSALGDAITNAMLLTRRVLREAGYVSDIFVEHRDPGLAGELRLIDELPPRDDYILIVRHSMGHDAFDRIMALPARKILLYHNITPAQFLADVPHVAAYAELGRRQLARMPDEVAAALADSAYNTIELSRLGFAAPAACTLLFDPAALRARAGRRQPGEVFTVLFVGRVSAAKAQLELVIAFEAFADLVSFPVRLILVGRHGGAGDAYHNDIVATVRDHGLSEQVSVTGLVSDDALHDWYRRADLYVSLSHHEGFGVPLVEAMAHSVPVLAWPCGAVPYTLGNPLGVLENRATAAVAARMAALAASPDQRAELVALQHQALDRFDLRLQEQVLLRALARAGAAPPIEHALQDALAGNVSFTIAGHFNGSYSLAAINRTLALQLDKLHPGRVHILPVEGAPTADLSGVPVEQRAALEALRAPGPPTGPEVVISQHYPVHVIDAGGDVRLALFYWEESVVPPETVDILNQNFDGVLAPSRFVGKVLRDCGVWRPIAVIGHAPNLEAFAQLNGTCGAAPGETFTFLHVSSAFARKGVDVLLAAYVRSFRRDDPVRLVIKSFANPHNDVAAQIARLQAADVEAPAIVSVEADIDESELLALYRSADTVVLPTRGEGFNLPAAEAMAAGVPLIVTGFGGHMDFVAADTARLLDYRHAPSRSHLAGGGSTWVEPDIDDLAQAMRAAFEGDAELGARARRAAATIEGALAPAGLRDRLARACVEMLRRAAPQPIRLAWISTWDVRCGIAEYSRHLLGALLEQENIAGVVVLADMRTGAQQAPRLSVRPCWRLLDNTSLPTLAAAIAAEAADAIVIQHQPGLFTWSSLAALLELPGLRWLAVTVCLHNTRELLDCSEAEQAWVIAALGGASRVIVHTVADLNRLKALGLEANVVLIPQGAAQAAPAVPARALTRSEPAGIGCYGFFLPNKGILQLIEALVILRARWPQVRLRLINAEYDSAASAGEIAACREAAGRAGLADAIDMVTEFLPPERSLSLLGACDLVVLPYQSCNEASSGALRMALSAGVCVAVTPLALFDEAEDAVVRLDGTQPAALAFGIDALLQDVARRRQTQQNAQAWLNARTWSPIARRLLGMLRGLVAK